MATNKTTIDHEARPSMASLLAGLLDDFRTLMRQELQLAMHEIRREIGKAKTAAISSVVGIGLVALGGLLLVLMLVHGLQAATGLPLWASYGLVGVALAISGRILIARGRSCARDVDFVPRTTLGTLKENAIWIKEQAKSVRT